MDVRAVQVHRLGDDILHIEGAVIGENEAVAVLLAQLAGADGVGQAAGLTHDRHRTVAHGDHLRKSAGLGAGGHQEEVAAGIDAVGQGLIVTDIGAKTAFIAVFRIAEEIFILPVAAAQDHQLAARLHHNIQALADEVNALVAHQTAHHGDKRHIALHLQAQFLLQSLFAAGLAPGILYAVMCRQDRIRGRIKDGKIYAVYYAAEFFPAALYHGLHALGISAQVELAGIGGTDGSNGIGAQHSPLHEIQAPIHLQCAALIPAPMQAKEVIHRFRAEFALIFYVVDGEHRADAAQGVPPAGKILPVYRHQRRLPVVAVDHIRHLIQQGQQFHHGPGKESEALPVVLFAVQPAPGKVVLVIHKIPGHAPVLQGKQTAVFVPPGQVYIDISAKGHLVPPLAGNGIIQRQDHRHMLSPGRQRHRQAAGNIRKTTGFTEGGGLPRYIQNIHLIPPSLLQAPWDTSPYPPDGRPRPL